MRGNRLFHMFCQNMHDKALPLSTDKSRRLQHDFILYFPLFDNNLALCQRNQL